MGLGGETPPRSQLRLKPPGAGSPFSGLTVAFSTKRNMTTEFRGPLPAAQWVKRVPKVRAMRVKGGHAEVYRRCHTSKLPPGTWTCY